MADILCLQGAAAFSAFRLQRLVDRLQVVLPKMVALRADYWHVVEVKRALSDAERAQLAALLEEEPAAAATGELFLVTPRIGTISPGLPRPPISPTTADWPTQSSVSSG